MNTVIALDRTEGAETPAQAQIDGYTITWKSMPNEERVSWEHPARRANGHTCRWYIGNDRYEAEKRFYELIGRAMVDNWK